MQIGDEKVDAMVGRHECSGVGKWRTTDDFSLKFAEHYGAVGGLNGDRKSASFVYGVEVGLKFRPGLRVCL